MLDILRDSTVGSIINSLSHGRLLPFPDQRDDFQIPKRYLAPTISQPNANPLPQALTSVLRRPISTEDSDEKTLRVASPSVDYDGSAQLDIQSVETAGSTTGNEILVDWYGEADPENPRNWSLRKRIFVTAEIAFLTCSVYIGSSIYTPSIPYVIKDFHVGNVVATLGLSLFVEGYSLGPLLFSPLQELPSLGHNPVYITTIILFALLQIPAALSTSIGGLLVLRFLSGLLGSPALTTGGATISNLFSPQTVPYVLLFWSAGGVGGPVLGPIVAGFAVEAKSWRWSLWELSWISGLSAILLPIFLPETSPTTILLKRARRLRKLTGNERLRSQSELQQAAMSSSEVAKTYLIRPFQLMLEPGVFFVNLYTGLAYAVFYLWFEAFPLVFIDTYHFKGGVASLPFLGILIGAFSGFIAYALYHRYYLAPKWEKGAIEPEEFLRLALFAGFLIPISLFIFGWTARKDVHWIAPVIGASLYMPGILLLFQSVFLYLPMSYPNYIASIFAGNNLFRASLGAVFPLFGKLFFQKLGVGAGCSILAGIAAALLPSLWLLMKYGSKLRAKSKYATSAG